MEAAFEARKVGKIRYIGFTGHKSPDIHLKMLQTCLAHNFTPAERTDATQCDGRSLRQLPAESSAGASEFYIQ